MLRANACDESSSAAQTTRTSPLGRTVMSLSVSSTSGVSVMRYSVLLEIWYTKTSAAAPDTVALSNAITPPEMLGLRSRPDRTIWVSPPPPTGWKKMSPAESKTMFVPSVSGFDAGAARTTDGALHTPPESVDFITRHEKPEHDDQVMTLPAGETAGLTSLSPDALMSTSGAPGFAMLPAQISPGEPFTNATVSLPSAVAP